MKVYDIIILVVTFFIGFIGGPFIDIEWLNIPQVISGVSAGGFILYCVILLINKYKGV
jgi:hypothetical protein